ncbi:MAG: Na/Pi cotransporter family protein [Flavobacteriales bacterium]|nr:Na/Pi cotransporter family protein [Flavobacteriales bacterium]
MFEELDIWKLLAGLGVFLFGMFLLEESIRGLAGRSFKKFIKDNTSNRVKAIFSGALTTSILQSSSAVGLMVLAFVGAGIMMMENAIGVIIGSNVGTTFTAWIVAMLGFKLDIESFSLPLIGIGGLILIFLGKSERYSYISKLMVGFGFLFMGLDYMKNSVSEFTNQIDIADLPHYGIMVYVFFGLVLTAVMQSSSASIAIVLTALHAGVVDFNAAAAFIIGANVGTTATILIGGIGGTQMKKRVAFSHLIFNLITGIVGLALFIPFTMLVMKLVGDQEAVIGIALFHTLFNVTGAILFLPFIGMFSRLLLKLFPDKQVQLTKYIHKITPQVGEAALDSIRNEVLHLIRQTLKFNLSILNIDEQLVFTKNQPSQKIKTEDRYENLKLLQAEIFTFTAKVQAEKLQEEESAEMNRLLHAARMAMHSAKSMKDIKHNFDDFGSDDNEFVYNRNLDFRRRLIQLYLRVIELFEEDKHEDIAGEMARLLKHINKEDTELVHAVQQVAQEKSITELTVSEMLMVNRVFIQSSRQILASIREVLLTADEVAMFDSMTDTDLLVR